MNSESTLRRQKQYTSSVKTWKKNQHNPPPTATKQANRRRKDVTFKVEDMVFLTNKNYNIDRPFKKLDSKKWGLFKVTKLIKTSYRLRLPATMRIYNVFYIFYLSKVSINPLPSQINPSSDSININKNEQKVLDVLNIKLFYGYLKYRVKQTG